MECPLCKGDHELSQCPRWRVPVKAVIVLALFGLLLVLCGWSLIRSDALRPDGGNALLGYALALVGVILVAAAKAAYS
jgi:hypothetical protein